MWYSLVIAVLTAYLLGNLNGAVCISAIISHEDVREHGSGNAGLTNFIRNYGSANALLVVLIDGGKAVLACLVGGLILQPHDLGAEGAAIGGAAVMLGHVWPALLGFKGGKGILSGLFIALVLDWRVAVIILVTFGVVYLLTGYVSLSSLLASAAFGIGFGVFHNSQPIVMACGIFMACLAIFMHRSNIVRLLKGQEKKTNLFGKGKQA